MPAHRKLSGINIQWPWTELLLSGRKTVETRSYPLPSKFKGVELAVIETPGPRGKRAAGIAKARVVGTIKFSGSYEYQNAKQWASEHHLHLVEASDVQFGFAQNKKKWAWTVECTLKFDQPVKAPSKRGIVFANNCLIPKSE